MSPNGAAESDPITGNLQDLDTLRHFETAFAAISEGSQVTIIVEGVPLSQSLTDDELGALQHSLPGPAGRSVESTVARVASAYDYEAERANSGVFLLRKCYSDPNDLPCVTFAEMVHGFAALTTFIDPEPAEPVTHGKDSVLWTLWDSLTPDQQANGPKGLKVSDMPPDQRALAMRATRFALLKTPLFSISELIVQLKNLGDKRSVFTWMKMVDGEAFGYEGPFRENGTIRQFPLNNGFTAQLGGAYSHSTIRPIRSGGSPKEQSGDAPGASRTGAAIVPVLPDPSAPTDLDRFLAPGMLNNRLPGTVTLGELAEQLTRAGSSRYHVKFDDGVAEKPVCIYGQGFTSSPDLVRGISDLYGLQVSAGDEGNAQVLMPRARYIENPADVAAELFRLLPAPISRYLLAQISRIVDNSSNSKPEWKPDKIAGRLRKYNSGSGNFSALQAAESTLYFPAVRRLLVLALPKVPTPMSPPVPVASLGPEVCRLIAFAMLSGAAMRAVSHLSLFKPPKCLTNPDSLLLHVYMNVHKLGASYEMVNIVGGYTDTSGAFVNEGGAGTARNVSKPAQAPAADPPDTLPTQAPEHLPRRAGMRCVSGCLTSAYLLW